MLNEYDPIIFTFLFYRDRTHRDGLKWGQASSALVQKVMQLNVVLDCVEMRHKNLEASSREVGRILRLGGPKNFFEARLFSHAMLHVLPKMYTNFSVKNHASS